MGDRANILIRDNSCCPPSRVYLYSHWTGSGLPGDLAEALSRQQRWDDTPYLARIIFDQMTKGEQGKETGYGITSEVTDGEDRILAVDISAQVVSFDGHEWSFEQFSELPKDTTFEELYNNPPSGRAYFNSGVLVDDQRLLDEMNLQPRHAAAFIRALGAPGLVVLGEWHNLGSDNYVVKIFEDGPTHYCTCPSYKFDRGLDLDGNCKHIVEVVGKELPGDQWYILKEDPRVRPTTF